MDFLSSGNLAALCYRNLTKGQDAGLISKRLPCVLCWKIQEARIKLKSFPWPTKARIASSVKLQIPLLITVQRCCNDHRATEHTWMTPHPPYARSRLLKAVLMLKKRHEFHSLPVMFPAPPNPSLLFQLRTWAPVD